MNVADNLKSETTARTFFRERSSITKYVDERVEGEGKGHIKEMLLVALQSNKLWTPQAIQEDLGFCIEITEHLSDVDIGKLSKDDFWQTYAYAVLLRIAKIDNLVQQYVDRYFLCSVLIRPSNCSGLYRSCKEWLVEKLLSR